MKRLIIFISIVLSCFFFMKQQAKCENESFAKNQLTADQPALEPDWTATCDQWSRYGDGISAGDINGDGYDDVAVGAPAYEPGGAVFIYLGSAAGPSTIPNKVLYGEEIGFGNRVDCKGDVNNDGYNDLIVADPFFGGGRVFVYHGSPSGVPDTANSQQRLFYYGGNDFGYTVSSADFNGDGYSDLIASVRNEQYNSSLNIIAYIFAGSASGINGYDLPDWIATVPINEFDVSNTIVSNAGDVNGDGSEDLIVALNYSGKALIYYGSPTRQFDGPADVILTDPAYEFGYYVSGNCDVNADAYDDILIGSRGGAAFAFYGSQNGLSQNYNWMKTGPDNCYGYVVQSAGDFNNDGFDDIAVSDCIDSIQLFFGNSAGLTDNYTELNAICYNASYGDINGDGISDVLSVRDPVAYGFYGSENISPPLLLSVSPLQNAISVNKSSDIKVEFGQEMNASTVNSSNIKVFGFETGLLSTVISYNSGSRTATINPNSNFKIGEKIQVTLTNGIKTSANIPINHFTWTFTTQALSGTGVFTEARIIDSVNVSDIGTEIKSGDIDGDGVADLISNGYFSGLNLYKNNGNGNFTLSQEIKNLPGVQHYSGFYTGDFDKDGDLDIVLGISTFTYFLDSIYTYINDGNGFFTKYSAAVGGGLLGGSADLDGDGDLDIGATWALDKVRYYINDGNGNFTNHLIENLGYYHTSGLDLGDVDNDGDIDFNIAIKDYDEIHSKVIIFLNDGQANFSIGSTYYTSTRYNQYFFADINSDNFLDMVSRDHHFFNNGDGTFRETFFSPGDLYSQPFPFDFDGDGDIDLTYANAPSNNVISCRNNGTGSFINSSNAIAGQFTNSGTYSDFDNDGDIDFAITNENGHRGNIRDISIMLNDYNCTHPSFAISGSSDILIGSANNLYVSSAPNGYWNISNYDTTQASIQSDPEGDSVLVSAGNHHGHFVLYFTAFYECGGDTIISKHVYVDYPFPVELTSFNSSVSGRNITLNWSTASELNNSGFEIERSIVNGQWSKVSFVNGSGTVSEPVSYTFTDKNLSTGKYKYRLKQIDFNGNFEYFELAEEVSIGIPVKYELSQNYPNPFNPITNLEFEIPDIGFVSLKIYDITGRELVTLVNGIKEPGYYKIIFNAGNLASGVYFYRLVVSSPRARLTELKGGSSNTLESGNFTDVKKMILLK